MTVSLGCQASDGVDGVREEADQVEDDLQGSVTRKQPLSEDVEDHGKEESQSKQYQHLICELSPHVLGDELLGLADDAAETSVLLVHLL